MNILIVSSNYFPEPLGIALYSHDLALTLKTEGHQVWVLTTYPYYPWWKTPKDLASFAVDFEVLDGIHVYRTPIHLGKSNSTINRMIFEFRMWLGFRKTSRNFDNQRFDKIISIIPSLGAGLVARSIAKYTKTNHYLIVQDVTTNGVSESGMSLGSFLKHLVLPIERRIIRSAISVAVISRSMDEAIRKIAGIHINLFHLPNYETGSDYPISLADRTDFDLPLDKFNIVHAGSIAKKQNLDALVQIAQNLRSTNVNFYLFGHGNAEEEIASAAEGLDNFFIRPAVPKERFKTLLKSADLLLVNERPTQVSMALPSKLISYFSSEVAVLAVVPKDGATYRAIDGLAFWSEAGKPEQITEAIKRIIHSTSERDRLARTARQYYEKELSAEVGRKRYIDWLFSIN